MSLELVDDCMQTKSSNVALAIQLADVNVVLKDKKAKVNKFATNVNMWDSEHEDIGNILSNIAQRDDHEYYKKQQAIVGKKEIAIDGN